ncbi:MAG TPA: hypothetical protein VF581_12310 [Flavobacterium sp.]|jgi:hypothetical protein
MKTIILTLTLFASLLSGSAFAQDRTTVNAMSYDISDNLDLRAVASIFGDSENLEDFERRLNNPKTQISNLDLNRDNQVDYLRVIESVEGNMHLIIIQSVIDRDVFQDVATVEVERDNRNNVQVQVVGDVYMYGNNYIYEPVYVHTPVIYSNFWGPSYYPYYSSYYYGYYPSYYYAWNPYPVYTYQNNIHYHINVHNHYNYVNTRRSSRAIALHNTRRSNGYETMNPGRSFIQRNTGVTNRYELATTRSTSGTRGDVTTGSTIRPSSITSQPTTRSEAATSGTTRSSSVGTTTRSESAQPTTRTQAPSTTRSQSTTRTEGTTRPQSAPAPTRTVSPSSTTRSQSVPSQTRSASPSSTRSQSTGSSRNASSVQPRMSSSASAPAQIRSAAPAPRMQSSSSQRSYSQPAASPRSSGSQGTSGRR